MSDIAGLVEDQHRYFQSGATRDVYYRLKMLKQLKATLKQHENEIYEALREDFGKPPFETYGTDIGQVYAEIDHMVRHLKKWARPKRVRGSLFNFPSANYIYRQPYGVALVIGAWNYPINLSLTPALGSIAAGNTTLIKPSEIAPHSSRVIAELVNGNFDPGFLAVVEGDADTTRELLDQPLDYIFFTGSSRVGKIIMREAAEQLTPVTLELGGKSPGIVDKTADLEIAARRLAWGKFMNGGQTCVAPDYVYVQRVAREAFIGHLVEQLESFFGPEPKASIDYSRIINRDHFDRLTGYLADGAHIIGGDSDAETLYIEPTILTDIDWDHPAMQEEIFGPILPVLVFDEVEEVIETVNSKPSPLALYLFTADKDTRQKVVEQTTFGGGCINDTLVHLGNPNLPFGGIGNSGFGNYNGKYSFETFSSAKSIVKKPTWIDIPIRYAPYGSNLKWLKKIFN